MMGSNYGLDVINRVKFIRVLKSSFINLQNDISKFPNININIKDTLNNWHGSTTNLIMEYDYQLKTILNYVNKIKTKN